MCANILLSGKQQNMEETSQLEMIPAIQGLLAASRSIIFHGKHTGYHWTHGSLVMFSIDSTILFSYLCPNIDVIWCPKMTIFSPRENEARMARYWGQLPGTAPRPKARAWSAGHGGCLDPWWIHRETNRQSLEAARQRNGLDFSSPMRAPLANDYTMRAIRLEASLDMVGFDGWKNWPEIEMIQY